LPVVITTLFPIADAFITIDWETGNILEEGFHPAPFIPRECNPIAGFASAKPATPEAALDHLSIMRRCEPPEPLPPGARRRSLLLKTGSRGTSPEFDLLKSTVSHFPALIAIGECLPALPYPDANFVTDLQTNNFASGYAPPAEQRRDTNHGDQTIVLYLPRGAVPKRADVISGLGSR
jgi:hypothetical protein